MVQSSTLSNSLSFLQAAQQGDLRAIAHWLNQTLAPYGMRARFGKPRSKRARRANQLRLLVEFDFPAEPDQPPSEWREQLIRFICHTLWQLNAPTIEGVNIAARFADSPQQILWQQSVRIVTPANRSYRQQRQQLRSRIRRTARQKQNLRLTRTLLVGGPAIAAVVVGGMLGYNRAPAGDTNAAAATNPTKALPTRPDTVRTALEVVPVVKHNQVANPKDPTVTLMFSGDVTLAEHFAEVVGKNSNYAFANLPEYRQADLAMVNLENPLTRSTLTMPGKQFNFKADPEAVKTLTAGGVDIVTLANNHTMDFDGEGLLETVKTLKAEGIEYVGAGKDLTEARRPQIIDVKGQRIAYFAYWGEEYGATKEKPGVNNIYEERIAEDIRAVRDQVDWVVVNYHWGQELATAPADWQVKLAHFTVDQGADVVVGHHPHVLQGAEIYKGRAIAYSLGNFIFGGNSRTDYDTALLKVALNDKQMKVEFLPVEVTNYQPKIVQGDRATSIYQHLDQISATFQQPMPKSVVLDARTPVTAAPTQTAREPQPPTGQAPAANIPGSAPAPAAASPAATPMQPAPPPTDPGNVLPGYGGEIAPPAPPQNQDALGIDPYDPFAAPLEPSNNSLTAPAPTAPASPQLPTFNNSPGQGFTNTPGQTPLEAPVAPPPSQMPNDPGQMAPAQSDAPQSSPTQASPGNGSPVLPNFPPTSAPSPDQGTEDWQGAAPMPPVAIAANPAPTQTPARSVKLPKEPQSAQTHEQADDVALAGPMMW